MQYGAIVVCQLRDERQWWRQCQQLTPKSWQWRPQMVAAMVATLLATLETMEAMVATVAPSNRVFSTSSMERRATVPFGASSNSIAPGMGLLKSLLRLQPIHTGSVPIGICTPGPPITPSGNYTCSPSVTSTPVVIISMLQMDQV